MSGPKENLMDIVAEGMEIFRGEMEAVDRISHKIGKKTTRIIRVIFFLLLVISVYLVYLTFNMGRDLSTMIDSLTSIYVEFGNMANDMRYISKHVDGIGENVRTMPDIVSNMKYINADIGDMLVSIEIINQDMGAVNASMDTVGRGTSEMAYRFHNVQRAVNMMQYDVYQMLRPIDMMPRW